MGRYFWIIFVLLGLWQLIGSVAERATKKQQNLRVSDLAAQRRRQQTTAGRTTAGGPALRATEPVAADRAGELAARRKAQLDELRRRRGQVTARAPSQPPARTRPVPAMRRPAASPVVVPRRPPTATPQARPVPPPPRRKRSIVRSTEDPRRLQTTRAVAEVKGPRTLALPGLGEVPMDRTLLRRMILYREILEPPIALREVQSWER